MFGSEIKKKLVIMTLGVLLMFLVFPTVVFVLREIIEKFHFHIDKITGKHIFHLFLSPATYVSFVSKVDPPNVIAWGGMAVYIVSSLLGLFGGVSHKNKYDQKEAYASHGSARWQKKEEIIKHYYQDDKGWFLGSYEPVDSFSLTGKYAVHPINGALNMQMNVIGPPGSNKTTGFVLPSIFHIAKTTKADMLITDPKSELHSLTASYLEEQGYEVKVLDFIHLKYGDSINTINFISDDKELMEIADGFVSASTAAKTAVKTGDPIWEDGESLLLGALIGFVKQVFPPEQQTFENVSRILSSREIRDPEAAEFFFRDNGITGATKELYDKFLLAEDKVRAGVLIGLAIKLKLFAIDGIKNITGATTVDIKKLGAKKDKPMALFVLMPDKDRTFSPIINVTVYTILNQLYKTAYEYNNKLYTPVMTILEEIANIGRLSGLQEMLGTMRGRRIYPMMIWQSLAQMKDRYKEGWEDILSMCDTQVYLGINDQTTAKYLSETLGNTTIKVQNISRSTKPGKILNDGVSESNSYMQRKLMFEDECMRKDIEDTIIVQQSRNPGILKKVQYKYWDQKHLICEPKPLTRLLLLKREEIGIEEDEGVSRQIIQDSMEEAAATVEPTSEEEETPFLILDEESYEETNGQAASETPIIDDSKEKEELPKSNIEADLSFILD